MSSVVAPVKQFRFAPILFGTVITVLLLWLVGAVADVLLLLFLAILISLALGAVTDFFVERFGVARPLALLGAVVLSLAALGGLLSLLVPPVIEQTQQLIKVLPTYISAWQAGIGRLVARYPALRDALVPTQQKILGSLYETLVGPVLNFVPRVISVVHVGISTFSVLVMSLYLTIHPGLYREWLIALFPPIHRDLVRDLLGDLATTLRAFIVSQMLSMTILAILTATGLYFLGVPYWLTFGVFTGCVSIIPFFGTLFSTTLPALFVLGAGAGGGRALLVILLGVVVHIIEGNFVMPLLTAKRLELPPVLSMVSVLIIGKLLGGVGLLVAVPTLASLMVILKRILINRIYEGQGFRRTARDRVLVLRVPAPQGGVITSEVPGLDVIAVAEQAPERRSA